MVVGKQTGRTLPHAVHGGAVGVEGRVAGTDLSALARDAVGVGAVVAVQHAGPSRKVGKTIGGTGLHAFPGVVPGIAVPFDGTTGHAQQVEVVGKIPAGTLTHAFPVDPIPQSHRLVETLAHAAPGAVLGVAVAGTGTHADPR